MIALDGTQLDDEEDTNPPVSAPPPLADCSGSDGAPFEIAEWGVEGDALDQNIFVEIVHPGGCGEHDYTICWPGREVSFDGPFAPVARLEILHVTSGDECTDTVSKRLSMNLDPLREAALDQHPELEMLTILLDGDHLAWVHFP